MNYYVLLYNQEIKDGAYLLENENAMGFESYEYYQCKSLTQYFDEPVELFMDKDDPDSRELYDLVWNEGKLLIVSEEFMKILEKENCGGIEFLPISIKDQRDKIVQQSYYIVNLLESIDYIDTQNSEIEYNSINPSKINEITKLVLNIDKIPDGRAIFRNKYKGSTNIVSETLKHKIEKHGLEGVAFVPVDEFDSVIHV